jgi:hypothetical protein
LEQSHGSSGAATVAFSAQGRGPPMHLTDYSLYV